MKVVEFGGRERASLITFFVEYVLGYNVLNKNVLN